MTRINEIVKPMHAYPGFYEKYGDSGNLGCVMGKIEEPATINLEFMREVEYVSPNPDRWWIKGLLDPSSYHVTVRYGLLPHVELADVKTILEPVVLPLWITASTFDIFPSTFKDEDYDCLVLRISTVYGDLEPINKALGVLPNVATFPIYSPHITIGYFKKDAVDLDFLPHTLQRLKHSALKLVEWDFGKVLGGNER